VTKAPIKSGDVYPNRFTIFIKDGVKPQDHLDAVQQLIQSTASCDSVKSSVDDTQAIASLGIYSATLGPSMLDALKKSKDVRSVEPDVMAELDAPIQAVQKSVQAKRLFGFNPFSRFSTTEGTWYVIPCARNE
jgi:hypothetical protein